jgi:hypothetical protein
MLELGGVVNLRARLKQPTLMELGELRLVTILLNLPLIKSCLHFNMFLVA